MILFETDQDLDREEKSIKLFCKLFNGSYEKLNRFDVDFKVFDSKGRLVAYVEVKGRNRKISEAYPLPLAARKAVKLCDKGATPIVIWDCLDGIIFADISKANGIIKYSGRKPRKGASNDQELMIYYTEENNFKQVMK